MANLPALTSGDKPLLTACPGGRCAANSRRSLARSRQVTQTKFMRSSTAPHPVLALQPPSPPPRHPPNPQPSLQPPPHQLFPQRCLRPQPRPSDGPRTAPCVDPVLKERPTTSSSRRRATAVGEAGARIAVLGSENLDPGVYPTAGPCISASLQRTLGLSRGLQLHGVPPLQWLEQ